jgi:cytoskeletal protein RodZ
MIIPINTRTGSSLFAGAALASFGEKLRKQREQRGLELDAISNTTKISPRMLRALEDEHFDQLPGGVFNKGFVRAYARQVGLDEEEAIADYLAALRESQIQQQTILPDFRSSSGKASKTIAPQAVVPGPQSSGLNDADLRGADPRNADLHNNDLPIKNSGNQHFNRQDSKNNVGGDGHYSDGRRKQQDRRRRDPEVFPTQGFITGPEFVPQDDEPSAPIPWGKLAAALLVVALLVVLWSLRRHRELTATAEPAASSTQPSATAPASSSTEKASSSDSLTVGKPSAAGTLSSGTLSPGTVTPETNSAKSPPALTIAPPTSKGASPAAPTSAAVNKPAAIPSSETTAAPLAKKTSIPLLKPPPTFTLLIRAEKTTWVSIVADGKPVAEETLIAPAHTSIRASHEIYVRAGNAAGVSFVLNGKEIPAQGADGEVKTYVFNATGLQATPPPQPAATNR